MGNSKTNISNRNQMIDIIRIFACFMVILCHVKFPSDVSRYSMAFARFSVPYFMMISGWFLWNEDNEKALSTVKKTLIKTIKFTLKSIIFMTLINIFVCLIQNRGPFDWFTLFDSEKKILLFFFANSAPCFASIVWYLLAMIYVLLIYLGSLKLKILKKMYFLIIPLIVINLVLGLVFDIEWYYSGNWLLTGLPFVLLGSYLHSTDWWKKINNLYYYILIVIGIILTPIEAYFRVAKVLYLGSLFIVLGIFIIAIKSKKNNFSKSLVSFGAKCTPIIFVIHCSLRDLLYAIVNIPGDDKTKFIMPFIIFILSSIVSIILVYFSNLIKTKRKKEVK